MDESKTKKIAICMLTVNPPPNIDLWVHLFQNIFINSKTNWESTGKEYRISNEVQDTAWGTASLIEAEKALFENALENTTEECNWFVLVSGDCMPTTDASKLIRILDSLENKDMSFICSYDYDKKEQKRLSKYFSKVKLEPDNWWVSKDISFHQQWIILSRKHAALVSQMDMKIATDWDKVVNRPDMPAADESCILNYLVDLGEGENINDDFPIMEYYTDPTNIHATIIPFSKVRWTHAFVRKVEEKVSIEKWKERYNFTLH